MLQTNPLQTGSPPPLQYYRSLLSAREQTAYDALVQQGYRLLPASTIPNLSADGLSRVCSALHLDNPALFYLDYSSLEKRFSPLLPTAQLRIRSLYPEQVVAALLRECEDWGRRALALLPQTPLSEEKKALWLHDIVAANVTYRDISLASHSLAGVFHNRIAVCEGIALAFKHLCDLCGLRCIVVVGSLWDSPSGGHAWNLVQLDRRQLFVDVTNDLPPDGRREPIQRTFFARTEREMQATHLHPPLDEIPRMMKFAAQREGVLL